MATDDFIRYIKTEKRYSPHTVSSYTRDIGRFAADNAHSDLFDPSLVTADDVRNWIVSLKKEGLSPTSINRMVSAVRSYYRYLRKIGAVETDPCARVTNLRSPRRLPVFVPETKMNQLAQRHGEGFTAVRDELIILLFYSTGIRLAELLSIRHNNITADRNWVMITGKGNKQRLVPLVGVVKDKLKEYLAEIKGRDICLSHDSFLILTEKGKPLSRSQVYRIVKGALAAAGVQGKQSPHVLRHTFATHMLNDGAGIREIQELLGHSSLGATQVYTHTTITKLKEVYTEAHPRAGKHKK